MKYSPRNFFRILSIPLLLICFLPTIQAQDTMQRWQSFDFSKSALKSADIPSLPLEDLKLMRGIVFGRHGRVFKDAEIRTFLESQSWYRANPNFQNSMLNLTERRNLDLFVTLKPPNMRTSSPETCAFGAPGR